MLENSLLDRLGMLYAYETGNLSQEGAECLEDVYEAIRATLTSDERTEHAQRIGGMILQSHPEIQDALKPKAKKPGGGTPGFFYQ